MKNLVLIWLIYNYIVSEMGKMQPRANSNINKLYYEKKKETNPTVELSIT